MDNSNSRFYLDPTMTQNIMCYQSTDTVAYVEYDWAVIRQSDQSVIFNSLNQSRNQVIQSNGNTMIIPQNTLTLDDFMVQCTASNLKY